MAEAVTCEDDLRVFLQGAAGASHVFSEWDCAMLLANWIEFLTGNDPAGELRGAYHSEDEWRRIVKRAGGLPVLVGSLAEKAGLVETDAPILGDIGVVDVPQIGHAGGIKTKRGWAVKLDRALNVADVAFVKAWSLPCRKL